MLGDEQIDPRRRRQAGGPGSLGTPLRGDPAGELGKVLDGVHAEIADPFEQSMQYLDGCLGVGERASVASLQLGTSSRSRICLASAAVSTTGQRETG